MKPETVMLALVLALTAIVILAILPGRVSDRRKGNGPAPLDREPRPTPAPPPKRYGGSSRNPNQPDGPPLDMRILNPDLQGRESLPRVSEPDEVRGYTVVSGCLSYLAEIGPGRIRWGSRDEALVFRYADEPTRIATAYGSGTRVVEITKPGPRRSA